MDKDLYNKEMNIMIDSKVLKEMQFYTIYPDLQGLVFRGFQGDVDYQNILDIINSAKDADGVQRSDTLEQVKNNYAHLHNCDPYNDMLFAEVDGKAVGYCRNWWEITAAGEFIGFSIGFVKAEWRRMGIGRVFLHFIEERLSSIARNLVENGVLPVDAPKYYDSFIEESQVGLEALLKSEGYSPARYSFSMVRPNLEDIPDLPLPPGLEVRPALPEHYRTIWDASNEAFQDHWGYIPEPEESFQRMIDDPNFDPTPWKVAWDGDQVAGMVLNFILKEENEEYNRKRGYTENICVRGPWRKQGLAKALIALSLKEIKERGMTEAALGVDAENLSGALGLYESMGFQVVKRSTLYRKPIS
jgi:mycothiol synthase